jgi:group I intron endonuclease
MNEGVIYEITNKINGKRYIGQAVSYTTDGRKWGSYRRWQSHVRSANNNKCECRLLENAIRKYGKDNFLVRDLRKCDISYLNLYEEQTIKELNTIAPTGYNLMTGGGNGRRHSIETRELMKKTRKGKSHNEKTKSLIGESNRGLIVNEEGKENIGKASKRRNISENNEVLLQNALDVLNIDNLPMYIYMGIDKRNNRNIPYIYVRIPNKPGKKFSKKTMCLPEKIKNAIEYKNSLT